VAPCNLKLEPLPTCKAHSTMNSYHLALHPRGFQPIWILSVRNTRRSFSLHRSLPSNPSLTDSHAWSLSVLQAYRIPTGSNAPLIGEGFAARRSVTWTFLSAIVRLYAVYDMDNGGLYILAFWTAVIACIHFAAERIVFEEKTHVRAVGVSLVSMGLMVACWSSYATVLARK